MMQENDPWVLLRLAEWRVVQSKLLPMLTVHLDDRCDPAMMLYSRTELCSFAMISWIFRERL